MSVPRDNSTWICTSSRPRQAECRRFLRRSDKHVDATVGYPNGRHHARRTDPWLILYSITLPFALFMALEGPVGAGNFAKLVIVQLGSALMYYSLAMIAGLTGGKARGSSGRFVAILAILNLSAREFSTRLESTARLCLRRSPCTTKYSPTPRCNRSSKCRRRQCLKAASPTLNNRSIPTLSNRSTRQERRLPSMARRCRLRSSRFCFKGAW